MGYYIETTDKSYTGKAEHFIEHHGAAWEQQPTSIV